MMKLHHQKTHAHPKSYDLYLFSPCEAVLNLSINLNSSRRSSCGDTFFTTDFAKRFKCDILLRAWTRQISPLYPYPYPRC